MRLFYTLLMPNAFGFLVALAAASRYGYLVLGNGLHHCVVDPVYYLPPQDGSVTFDRSAGVQHSQTRTTWGGNLGHHSERTRSTILRASGVNVP